MFDDENGADSDYGSRKSRKSKSNNSKGNVTPTPAPASTTPAAAAAPVAETTSSAEGTCNLFVFIRVIW